MPKVKPVIVTFGSHFIDSTEFCANARNLLQGHASAYLGDSVVRMERLVRWESRMDETAHRGRVVGDIETVPA